MNDGLECFIDIKINMNKYGVGDSNYLNNFY